MQIKYVKDSTFSSDGVQYFKDEIVEVSDELGNRLVSTFGGFFEVISKTTTVEKSEAIVTEPKVAKTVAKK